MTKFAIEIVTADGGYEFIETYDTTPEFAAKDAFKLTGKPGTYTVFPAFGENPADNPLGTFQFTA